MSLSSIPHLHIAEARAMLCRLVPRVASVIGYSNGCECCCEDGGAEK
jgi:hypothetical protein